MPTPASVMTSAAALLNDTGRVTFTNAVQLPFFDIALNDLQEVFELNNIPVTNQVSGVIGPITAGDTVVGFNTTPSLPSTAWPPQNGTPGMR